MLDVLRKKSQSKWVKILFAIIIVVFVLFFGYDRISDNGGSQGGIVAKVDGTAITRGEYRFLFDNLHAFYQRIYKDGLPPNMMEMLEQSALTQLIEQTLLANYADTLQLAVSEGEIRDQITHDPQFQHEGNFDPVFYREQVLPYVERKYGMHYEALLAKRLLADKVRDVIESPPAISETEIRDAFERAKTGWKLKVVKVHSTPNESIRDPKKTATEIQAAMGDAAKLKGLLKKYGMVAAEMSVTVSDTSTHFGSATVDQLAPFFQLTLAHPDLASPILIGENEIAARLIGLVKPSEELWKKDYDSFKGSFLNEEMTRRSRAFMTSLHEKATIQTYLD